MGQYQERKRVASVVEGSAPDSSRRSILFVLFVVTILLPPTVAGQDCQEPTETPAAKVLWHKAPALFPVRIVVPAQFDSTRIYPAVVALHGFGSSSKSFQRVAQPFARAGFVVILPEAPYPVPAPDSARHSSWYLTTSTTPPLTDDATLEYRSALLTTIDFVPSAVDAVQERYRLGPIYIFGFSLGGFESLVAGFYNRDRFDGIIAAGVRGFDREWFTAQGDLLEAGKDLPVLLIQARSDPLAPFSEAERARDVLRAAGYSVTLHDFLGGHEMPEKQLDLAVDWLKSLSEP